MRYEYPVWARITGITSSTVPLGIDVGTTFVTSSFELLYETL